MIALAYLTVSVLASLLLGRMIHFGTKLEDE